LCSFGLVFALCREFQHWSWFFEVQALSMHSITLDIFMEAKVQIVIFWVITLPNQRTGSIYVCHFQEILFGQNIISVYLFNWKFYAIILYDLYNKIWGFHGGEDLYFNLD
jgi:hypothetical protein